MQCQGVTLVPIYRHSAEKFVIRDTYTHAGAKQECKTHNSTLAKEAQPTHNITECLKRFGQKVLSTTNAQNQLIWLGDCSRGQCRFLMGTITHIFLGDSNNHNTASTLALCQEGKTQLVPHILHHLRTDLTLLC